MVRREGAHRSANYGRRIGVFHVQTPQVEIYRNQPRNRRAMVGVHLRRMFAILACKEISRDDDCSSYCSGRPGFYELALRSV
jgi:hypothetical protein